jgi:hypothetical protein
MLQILRGGAWRICWSYFCCGWKEGGEKKATHENASEDLLLLLLLLVVVWEEEEEELLNHTLPGRDAAKVGYQEGSRSPVPKKKLIS